MLTVRISDAKKKKKNQVPNVKNERKKKEIIADRASTFTCMYCQECFSSKSIMFLPSQKLEKVPNTDEQHCRIHESASRAKSIQDGVKIFFRHRFQSVASP